MKWGNCDLFRGSGKASCVITCLLSSKERRWPAPHPLPQTSVKLIVPRVLNSDGLRFSFCLHSKVSSLTESWPGFLPFPFPAPHLEQFCFRRQEYCFSRYQDYFQVQRTDGRNRSQRGHFLSQRLPRGSHYWILPTSHWPELDLTTAPSGRDARSGEGRRSLQPALSLSEPNQRRLAGNLAVSA